ncbi:hypothetical protein JMG10_07115 [Nostoc ellipsosporum NOK]|nr:hypothetical protein [Nostoc ellipsosporum NOK]
MKKILMLSAGVMLISSVTTAQNEMAVKKHEQTLKQEEKQLREQKKETRKELKKLEGNEVSYMTKQQFYSDFDDITEVAWRRTENYDIASFTQDGVSKSAYYDANSKLVGTVEPKTFKDLPEKAQQYIKKKWGSYQVMHVIYFNDNEWNDTDMLLYGEQFDDADNYFIELSKGSDKVILQSDTNGETGFFAQVK